jgi:hypothetical protein
MTRAGDSARFFFAAFGCDGRARVAIKALTGRVLCAMQESGIGPFAKGELEMPVHATVGNRTYPSDDRDHAEEKMFASNRYNAGNFTVELDAWPCTGEKHHNCHQLLKQRSMGRVITAIVTGDHGGYARNHGLAFGATGTITYTNGEAAYA